MNTGQPLVTSKAVVNYLSDHAPQGVHIYTGMYIQSGIWAMGRIFACQQNASFCCQKDCTSSRSVSMHSYLSYDA